MSSVRVSVSGQRALTTTTNDPASTSSFMPTKVDDKAIFSIGNANEIRFNLPKHARLELVGAKKKDGTIGDERYLRVVIPRSGNSLSLFVDGPQPSPDGNGTILPDGSRVVGSWPHIDLSLGKHLRDYFADDENYPVVETLYAEVGDLIPPTE